MEQNMKFSVLKDGLSGTTADCLVIGAGIGSTGSVFSSLPDSLKKLITQAVEEKTFSGNFKEIRQLTVSERPCASAAIFFWLVPEKPGIQQEISKSEV